MISTIGNKSVKNGVVCFEPGYTCQGYIFKDMETFYNPNKRDEICYIAEAGFDDRDCLTESEAIAEVGRGGADTHNSIFEYVKSELKVVNEEITDEFVEQICEYLIEECDWQCLSTMFSELDFEEDWEYYKKKSV